MAAETELERLVVRLMGDGTSFQRMMSQAASTTVQTSNLIEKHTDRVQGFGFGLRRYALNAVGAMGLFGGAVGLLGTSITSISRFANAEEGLARLDATLTANGRNVGAVTEQYNRFAAQIQRLTVLDDDAVISLLRTAETYGLTGEMATEAARKAIALAGAVDGTAMSAQNYVRIAAALQQGDVQRAMLMSRLVPQLRGIRDETEFVTKANQLFSIGLSTNAKEVNTLSGQWKQFKAAFDNSMESIGEGVVNAFHLRGALDLLTGSIRSVDEFLKSLPSPLRSLIAFLGAGATAVTVFTLAWPLLRSVGGASLAALMAPLAAVKALILGKAAATTTAVAANAALAASSNAVSGALTMQVAATRAATYGMTVYASAAHSAAAIPIAGVPVATAVSRWGQLVNHANAFASSLGGITIGVTAAVVGGVALGNAIYASFESAKKLADQTERTNRLYDRFATGQARIRQEELSGVRGMTDPTARAEAARREIERMERQLQQAASPEQRRRGLVEGVMREGRIPSAGDIEIITRETARYAEQLALTQGQLEEFRRIQTAALEQIANQGQTAYRGIVATLHEEARAIGLTAEQQQLATAQRANATPAMLAEIRMMQEANKQRKEAAALRDDVEALNKQIIEQAALYGLSGRALEEARLRLRGWTGELSAAARAAAAFIDEEEAWADIWERADRIIAESMTPLQKYGERIEELEYLLSLGAISWDVFTRAVERANAELEGTAQAIAAVDAAAAGSAEAAARIAAYQEAIGPERGRIRLALEDAAGGGGGGGGGSAGPDRIEQLLVQIAATLQRIEDLTGVEVEEVDLT